MSLRVSFIATRLFVLVICLVVFCAGSALAALLPLRLDNTKPNSNSSSMQMYARQNIGMGGKIYEGYITGRVQDFATWVVPNGYTTFEGYCGSDDTVGDSDAQFAFYIDGDVVKTLSTTMGSKAIKVSIPVRAGQSFRIDIVNYGAVAEPQFLTKASENGSNTSIDNGSVVNPPVNNPALFSIDSNGLDRLSDSLRKQCEAKPALKQKMENGQVAIATFKLIGISSKTVADAVTENLYTSMIKCGFSLVERGQLDKVLTELKIQDSGAIDPATAQKIGKLSGCDIILVGSISDQGLVVINGRMMETETGKSLVAERVELQKIPVRN